MATTTITQVNIYRASGEWCYAAFGAEGFDVSDSLGLAAGATEADARAAAAKQFPAASISRVEDVR